MTWSGRVMRMLQILTDLVLINLLIIAGTVAGLGVLGLMPSLVAAASVLRSDRAEGIIRPFLAAYRARFFAANRAGFPFGVAAIILAADAAVIPSLPGQVGAALLVMTAVGAAVVAVASVLTVVVLTHHEERPLAVARFGVVLTLVSPGLALAVLATIVATAVFAVSVPVLMPLVGFSVPLALCCRLSQRSLDRVGAVQAPALIHEGVLS
ncbi:MAG: DUF624 domain-containing protein [Microbacterium sp.]